MMCKDLDTGEIITIQELEHRMVASSLAEKASTFPVDGLKDRGNKKPVKKEGYLTKESRGGLMKNWKRRYFILEDRQLKWVATQGDSTVKGTMDCSECKLSLVPESSKPHAFKLTDSKMVTLTMVADSAQEASDWVAALASAQFQRVGLVNFELLRTLGKGAYGKVLLVRKKDNGKLYAMKNMSKSTVLRKDNVGKIKTENNILRALDHPYLVNLKFAFQTPGALHLVMEFLPGGDLFAHMKRHKRFPEEWVRIYSAEVVLALAELHAQGIVYRDLKPENIMMGSDGHLKVTDFGLSKSNMEEDDVTTTFCGTNEYFSPEMLKGHAYGKEVDWWTLGILVYELLCGRSPFYAGTKNKKDTYERILRAPLAFPEAVDISAAGKDLISKLLVRDPKTRLGYGSEGASQIKTHPFYAETDFEALMRKEVEAPFVPKAATNATDTSNFDKHFTSQAPRVSDADLFIDPEAQERFRGFTFVGPEHE